MLKKLYWNCISYVSIFCYNGLKTNKRRFSMTSYTSAVSDQADQPCLRTILGKVVLIVNTATGCGLTPQYQGLQNFMTNAKTRIRDSWITLVIGLWDGHLVGAEEINSFCPQLPPRLPNQGQVRKQSRTSGLKRKIGLRGWIRWNFAKFLINHVVKVLERFSSNWSTKNGRYIRLTVCK